MSSERKKLCQKLKLPIEFDRTGNQKAPRRYASKDEKNFCMYCGKGCAKVVRHFSFKHTDETQVRKLLSLPVRSEERIALAAQMRAKGNQQHAKAKKKREFFPCEHCGGTFRRPMLARHVAKCAKKDEVIALEPVSAETEALFKSQVLDTMAKDDLAMIIHADPLILEYGVHLFAPGRKKSTLIALKRKIRVMAKFLEALMHRNSDVECIKQVLHPSYFRDVLHCAKKQFSYCTKSDTFKNAFSSYYVTQGLRFCAQLEQRRLTLDGQSDKPIKSFLRQLETNVGSKVSRTGPKQYLPPEHTLNKVAHDVTQLSDFLDKERSELEVRLNSVDGCEAESFLRLLKTLLASMVLLNAPSKRLVETVTVEDFRGIEPPSTDLQEEADDPDSVLTQDLFQIRKQARGEVVCLVLTEDLKRSLDLSLSLRDEAGVNASNPFLFPRVYHSSLYSLKASICLKESLQLAGLKEPPNLLASQLDRTVARLFNTIHLPLVAHGRFVGVLNSRSKINLGALEPNNHLQVAYVVSLMEGEEQSSKEETEDD